MGKKYRLYVPVDKPRGIDKVVVVVVDATVCPTATEAVEEDVGHEHPVLHVLALQEADEGNMPIHCTFAVVGKVDDHLTDKVPPSAETKVFGETDVIVDKGEEVLPVDAQTSVQNHDADAHVPVDGANDVPERQVFVVLQ